MAGLAGAHVELGKSVVTVSRLCQAVPDAAGVTVHSLGERENKTGEWSQIAAVVVIVAVVFAQSFGGHAEA